jgi:mono/diheme cytochrome c family protein
VHAKAPENTLTFPYNQRWAMTFWSALFNPDTRFAPDSDRSPEWNRGAYLAEALAHCGECHTPRNLAFALDNRKKFAGALTAGWRAFNISSDKATGIGGWRDEDLAAYLAIGHADGHGTASGPMGEAVDRSFSQLAPEDIRAVVVYLRTVPPIASPDLPATLAPPAPASHRQGGGSADARGKMLFEGACVSCHGWTGESPISSFATFTGAWAVNDPSGTNVVQVVLSGTSRLTPEDAVSMPAFGGAYSDAEIAALANYVTARFGAKASRVTAQDVAELRKQTSR